MLLQSHVSRRLRQSSPPQAAGSGGGGEQAPRARGGNRAEEVAGTAALRRALSGGSLAKMEPREIPVIRELPTPVNPMMEPSRV